jgi:hypothetical protein
MGLLMTPANQKQRPDSITDSETTRSRSIINGLDFVHRLKKKDKDDSSPPSSNGQDDNEEPSRRKSKSLKTILSGMTS